MLKLMLIVALNLNLNPHYTPCTLLLPFRYESTHIVKILRLYPYLIWMVNDDKISIFHIVVMYHHNDIYNVLYEIGSIRDCIIPLKDTDGNKMLHLVGMTSRIMRSHTSGASLLMQRELSWFKVCIWCPYFSVYVIFAINSVQFSR